MFNLELSRLIFQCRKLIRLIDEPDKFQGYCNKRDHETTTWDFQAQDEAELEKFNAAISSIIAEEGCLYNEMEKLRAQENPEPNDRIKASVRRLTCECEELEKLIAHNIDGAIAAHFDYEDFIFLAEDDISNNAILAVVENSLTRLERIATENTGSKRKTAKEIQQIYAQFVQARRLYEASDRDSVDESILYKINDSCAQLLRLLAIAQRTMTEPDTTEAFNEELRERQQYIQDIWSEIHAQLRR